MESYSDDLPNLETTLKQAEQGNKKAIKILARWIRMQNGRNLERSVNATLQMSIVQGQALSEANRQNLRPIMRLLITTLTVSFVSLVVSTVNVLAQFGAFG